MTAPFVVATGARTIAENMFLRVTLSNGAQGYGEAAPFPEVGGETRESCLIARPRLGKAILGHSAASYTNIGHVLSEQAPNDPAARCGLETAVIDAYCRASNILMWQLWGSADVRARETDITIPITDLDSMAAIRRETGIPVAADESVRSLADAQEVAARAAADYINIKIMKTGVIEAVAIASFTKASDLKLMIGGMLETRITMGCSFSLVLGLGGFDVLDLDTPLLLTSDPVTGGYRYEGSRLQPWSGPGLDMNAVPSLNITTIE